MNYTSALNSIYSSSEDYIYGYEDNIWYIFQKVTYITVYSITFILGVVGNGLVIWFTGFKMKRTINIIWFLNLAIADFCFCLSLPFATAEWVLHHWPFGQITCKVVYSLFFLNMSVSVLFLMISSVDRCICVMYPLWSAIHRTSKRATVISLVTWFLSFTLNVPYFVFLNVEYNHYKNTSYCTLVYVTYENPNDEQTYYLRHNALVITRFISAFLIPCSAILICYGIIACRIRKLERVTRTSRTLKIIITVTTCFFLCSSIYNTMLLLQILGVEIDFYADIVAGIGYCLVCVNSCLNPLVYVLYGWKNKKELKEVNMKKRYF